MAAFPPVKPSQLIRTRGCMRTGRVFLQSLFFQRQGPRPPVLPPEERGASRVHEPDAAAIPAAALSPPAAVRGDRALGIPCPGGDSRRPPRLERGNPFSAGQTSLLHLGTEAAALEQNSIISLFLFVCSFKRIFRTALCQKSSLLFLFPSSLRFLLFRYCKRISRAGPVLSARAFETPLVLGRTRESQETKMQN